MTSSPKTIEFKIFAQISEHSETLTRVCDFSDIRGRKKQVLFSQFISEGLPSQRRLQLMVTRKKICLCITGEEIVGSVDEMDCNAICIMMGEKMYQNKIYMSKHKFFPNTYSMLP